MVQDELPCDLLGRQIPQPRILEDGLPQSLDYLVGAWFVFGRDVATVHGASCRSILGILTDRHPLEARPSSGLR
jgi:hypothetical protein